jgi:hypothetical protein
MTTASSFAPASFMIITDTLPWVQKERNVMQQLTFIHAEIKGAYILTYHLTDILNLRLPN